MNQLDKIAKDLRQSGFFLDVAALPGADRIVAIDHKGVTHTWTLDKAQEVFDQIVQISKTLQE